MDRLNLEPTGEILGTRHDDDSLSFEWDGGPVIDVAGLEGFLNESPNRLEIEQRAKRSLL